MSVTRLIIKLMERLAPPSLAESWDNVGLLLEAPFQPQRDVHNILLTIDLTTKVVDEAIALPASAIIAYHPPIFKPLRALTLANPLQTSLLRCAAAGISVYAPHTALDSVSGGINDWLARGLGAGEVRVLQPEGGVGRVVILREKVSMGVLQERIKRHLQLSHLQVALSDADPGRDVQSIAICAGSGGSVLLGADADVYWTGEMSHHEVVAAVAAGKNVVLCGHTNTERPYLDTLAQLLESNLKGLEGEDKAVAEQLRIHVSKKDRHPLDIV